MDIIAVADLLKGYNATIEKIDRTIHPQDDMFAKSPKGWDDYMYVGRSGIDVIATSLVLAPLQKVTSILDFGCGHGRVARHFPLFTPDAKLYFSDIDPTCWEFCASQFKGQGFPSVDNFADLTIPAKVDVIFLGSVFTHLDWNKSVTLWRKLFDALNPGGAIIATFRGALLYRMMLNDPDGLNTGGYYNPMLDAYRETGFGYQDYKGFKDWGQNIFSPGKIAELSGGDPAARLVGLKEVGWSNVHDVAVWTRK